MPIRSGLTLVKMEKAEVRSKGSFGCNMEASYSISFGVILSAQPQKFDVPLTARKTPE